MDMLERELERTLRSVHTDEQMPADLQDSIRRRRQRRVVRTGGATVAAIVAVVAFIAAGGILVGNSSSPRPSTGKSTSSERTLPPMNTMPQGRITVDKKLDDGVAAGSILGFLDDTHVVVSPAGAESSNTIRNQVVDLQSGKSTVFMDLTFGDEPTREYADRYTDGVYVWAMQGTIHAIDVRTGKRWFVGRIVTKRDKPGSLTEAEMIEQTKPLQFAVGSGYVVWRNYTKIDQQVFAAKVTGGKPLALPTIPDDAVLTIDSGDLAAYDGRTVRVIDLATGKLLTKRPFAKNTATEDLIAATCGVEYCVRGKKAPGARAHETPDNLGMGSHTAYDAVVPEVFRVSDGRSIAIPGMPIVTRGNDEHGTSPFTRPTLVADWLAFSSGAGKSPETGYLVGINDASIHPLGSSQYTVTNDRHLVSLDVPPGVMEGSISDDVKVRYTKLP